MRFLLSPQKQRILIANVWSDKNRGELAIALNTIHLLKKFFPHSKIYMCSSFGFNEIHFIRNSELREIARRTKMKVLGGLFPTYISKRQPSKVTQFGAYPKVIVSRKEILLPRVKRYMRIASTFAFAFFLLISSSLRLLKYLKHTFPEELKKTLEAFQLSDLVIIKGGGYLTSRGLLGAHDTLRQLYPALFSIALKKPFALIGHSVWDLNAPFSKFLFKKVTERAVIVTLREKSSYNYVTALGLTTNTMCLPDVALLKTFTPHAGKVHLESPRSLVGITVKYFRFSKSITPERLLYNYVKTIARFINHVVNVYGCSVVLIPHTIMEVNPEENDTLMSEWAANEASSEHVKVLDTSEMSIEEMLEVYSRLEVLVGTRTHSGIFALHVNTPVVLISYAGPKAPGIMEMLGLQDYVLDIYQITFDGLVSIFQKVWKEREKIRSKIVGNMTKLNQRVLFHGVFLKKAVNNSTKTNC
jgi:colanic acid/amylovoran biosynthesis protein